VPRVNFSDELSDLIRTERLFPELLSLAPREGSADASHSTKDDPSRHLAEILLEYKTPIDAIRDIETIIERLIHLLDREEFREISRGVFLSRRAVISPSAEIIAPAVIMQGAELRHSAYIRGKVIIGKGAVIGNSSEVKSSIILDEAKLPHFNYVGDSVIGYRAHLGAGAIISNLRSDKEDVTLKLRGVKYPTFMHKLGALVGDESEIGCGAVLNPGTVIPAHTTVRPNSSISGILS
jgi:NDP-sugar pyrophosphorylase family protein